MSALSNYLRSLAENGLPVQVDGKEAIPIGRRKLLMWANRFDAEEIAHAAALRDRDEARAEVARLNEWINTHAYDRNGFKI